MKKQTSKKIDLAISLSMAVYGLTLNPVSEGPHIWWIELNDDDDEDYSHSQLPESYGQIR